jgi:predicted amidophosphoribosyltransferase
VTSYHVGDAWHARLRGYKDAPVREERRACLAAIVRAVERWFACGAVDLRTRCPAWELVVAVPSSHRSDGSPVGQIVEGVGALAARHRRVLTRGSGHLGHLRADPLGFAVGPDVRPRSLRGRRVLVVDDTFTTGSHAQSAVVALRGAGAVVAGVLVVGRALGPLAVVSGGRSAGPIGALTRANG